MNRKARVMTRGSADSKLAADREALRARLAEADEVLRAIRDGEVDAVVVAAGQGDRVYTLSGADRVYRQLVETMSEGAVTLSADGLILYCNGHMAKMLALPLDQVLGTALRDRLPPADQEALDAVLAQARMEPSRREISLITGDGLRVPAYLSASRLQGEGAETVFCLVLTDLTELRARTAEVEAANKELEAFTASVSHDLRAPLRSMAGYSGILMEEYAPKLEPEGARLLGLLRKRVQGMAKLIDDLLAFSKLGREAMAKSAVSMNALVRESVEALEDQRGGRPIRFTIGELAPCEGDAALLKQVWINLLANALKFTRGLPEARIEIDSGEAAGETVYRVKDNGAGFDMRDAGMLFKAFQRLHPKEEFEGTGVGLAIVSRIVERHGGRIWARAEPGRGAEFFFTVSPAALRPE
jgi:PAS domain S-box-containing protein